MPSKRKRKQVADAAAAQSLNLAKLDSAVRSGMDVFSTLNSFSEDFWLSKTSMLCRMILACPSAVPHIPKSPVIDWVAKLVHRCRNAVKKLTLDEKSSANGDGDGGGNDEEETKFGDSQDRWTLKEEQNHHSHSKDISSLSKSERNGLIRQLWCICALFTATVKVSEANQSIGKVISFADSISEGLSGEFSNQSTLRKRMIDTLVICLEFVKSADSANERQRSAQCTHRALKSLMRVLEENYGRSVPVLNGIYRLLSSGKSTSGGSYAGRLTQICWANLVVSKDESLKHISRDLLVHCLASNDVKLTLLLRQSIGTCHVLIRMLFDHLSIADNPFVPVDSHRISSEDVSTPESDIDAESSSFHSSGTGIIKEVFAAMPSKSELMRMDSVERNDILSECLSGVISVLCHCLRKRNRSSIEGQMSKGNSHILPVGGLTAEDRAAGEGRSTYDTSGRLGIDTLKKRQHQGPSKSRHSGSCAASHNHLTLVVPVASIFAFLWDLSSLSNMLSHRSSRFEDSIVLCRLIQDGLWLMTCVVASLGRSILPFTPMLGRILTSLADDTKITKMIGRRGIGGCTVPMMILETRVALFRCIGKLFTILGPVCFDTLWKDSFCRETRSMIGRAGTAATLHSHLISDLKAARLLLVQPPPIMKANHHGGHSPFIENPEDSVLLGDDFISFDGESKAMRKRRKLNTSSNRATNQKSGDKGGSSAEGSGAFAALHEHRTHNLRCELLNAQLQCLECVCQNCSIFLTNDERLQMQLLLVCLIFPCFTEYGIQHTPAAHCGIVSQLVSSLCQISLTTTSHRGPLNSVTMRVLESAKTVAITQGDIGLLQRVQQSILHCSALCNPRSQPSLPFLGSDSLLISLGRAADKIADKSRGIVSGIMMDDDENGQLSSSLNNGDVARLRQLVEQHRDLMHSVGLDEDESHSEDDDDDGEGSEEEGNISVAVAKESGNDGDAKKSQSSEQAVTEEEELEMIPLSNGDESGNEESEGDADESDEDDIAAFSGDISEDADSSDNETDNKDDRRRQSVMEVDTTAVSDDAYSRVTDELVKSMAVDGGIIGNDDDDHVKPLWHY